MKKIRNSISFRLAKYGIIVAFIFGTIISVAQIYFDYKKQDDELANNITETVRFVNESLGKAIFEIDDAFVVDILNGLLNYPPITNATVFDENKTQIANISKKKEVKKNWIKGFFSSDVNLSYPVGITQSGTGTLRITANTYYMLGAFIERAWLVLISGIIRNVILASILLLLCYCIISKPVIQITRKLSFIDAKEPKTVRIYTPSMHTRDELGQLISSVNELLDTIMSINKSLEDKVDARTEELNHKTQEAVNTLEQLKITQKQLVSSEKNAALGELVAGVSHEINTPLGISVTAASHLEDETNSLMEKQRNSTMKKIDLLNYVDVSINSTNILLSNLSRAAKLIKSFKQIAVDQTSEEKREFQIVAYFEEVLTSLVSEYNNRKVTIKIKGDRDIVVDSYPGSYAQIFSNFIMNSLIHAFDQDDEGAIYVDIEMGKDMLTITYNDNGKGMSEESVKKVFNPFYTTKRGTGGTGLGMSVIFNIIIVKLGGEIDCESKIGRGTSFIIKIPLTFEDNKIYRQEILPS